MRAQATELPSVIGVSGYARSGKDAVCAVLVSVHGYRLASFGQVVLAALLEIDPFVPVRNRRRPWRAGHPLSVIVAERGPEAAKDIPEVRRMLQGLGKAVRAVDPTIWSRAVIEALDPAERWAVSGIRFPEDAQALRAAGGIVLRVDRPGTGPALGDQTETALDDWPFDGVVRNDGGLEDLPARLRDALTGN